MRKPNHIRPALRKKIDQTFLPEIHRARWAERLAQLAHAKKRASTPEEQDAIAAQIREHYGYENDLEWTRRELSVRRADGLKNCPSRTSLWHRWSYYVREHSATIRAWWRARHAAEREKPHIHPERAASPAEAAVVTIQCDCQPHQTAAAAFPRDLEKDESMSTLYAGLREFFLWSLRNVSGLAIVVGAAVFVYSMSNIPPGWKIFCWLMAICSVVVVACESIARAQQHFSIQKRKHGWESWSPKAWLLALIATVIAYGPPTIALIYGTEIGISYSRRQATHPVAAQHRPVQRRQGPISSANGAGPRPPGTQ